MSRTVARRRLPTSRNVALVALSVVLGTVVAAAVVTLFVMLVNFLFFRQQPHGFISEQQYQSVRIGERQADVDRELGPADDGGIAWPGPPGSGLPPAAAGTNCVYYSETNSLTDPNIYRFCYADSLLAAKGEYLDGRPTSGG